MGAFHHALGTTYHWVRRRGKDEKYLFLGTAVTSPDVNIEKVTSDVTTDLIAPAPCNYLYHSEIHTVTTTLNAVDYTTLKTLQARGTRATGGTLRGDSKKTVGKLMVSVEDFELLLLFSPAYPALDCPPGRLYYSATPTHFRETTENNRILEAGIVFRCIPVLVPEIKFPPKPATKPRTFTGTVADPFSAGNNPTTRNIDLNRGPLTEAEKTNLLLRGINPKFIDAAIAAATKPLVKPPPVVVAGAAAPPPTDTSLPSKSPVSTEKLFLYLYTEISYMF